MGDAPMDLSFCHRVLPRVEAVMPISKVAAQQQDFGNQKRQLEAHRLTIFYPKSHCGLNFIEDFGVQLNGMFENSASTRLMALERFYRWL